MALSDYYSNLVIMEKKTLPDGMGGFNIIYEEGAEFKGAIIGNISTEARLAEKQGVTSIFTLTIPKSTPILYNDIIKKKDTSEYFRITSDPNDIRTPDNAQLDTKQATAEKWDLI